MYYYYIKVKVGEFEQISWSVAKTPCFVFVVDQKQLIQNQGLLEI